MAARYEAWMAELTHLQARLDAGVLLGARAACARLHELATHVAVEGLDRFEVCRVMSVLTEASLLTHERDFSGAQRLLETAEPRVPIDTAQSAYVRTNRLITAGNLAIALNAIEQAAELFHEALRSAPSPLAEANASYNLGNCLTAQKAYGAAERAYEFALRRYEALERDDKVADCLHALGNVARGSGDLKKAGGLHTSAGEIFRARSDFRGAWMALDDASRDMFMLAQELEGTEEGSSWLELAVDYSHLAAVASSKVWASASDNERLRLNLSAQFEIHLANRIEFALAKVPTLVHLALAQHKGRVRTSRPESLELLARLVNDEDERRAIREGFEPAFLSAVEPALRLLLDTNERVAVLDQFCIHGCVMVTAVYLIDAGSFEKGIFVSELSASESVLGDREAATLQAPTPLDAQAIANRLLEGIRLGGKRSLALVGSSTAPEAAERAQLSEWSAALDEDAELLGDWFFPSTLLEMLDERKVDHVVLVPDPRCVQIPFQILRSEGRDIGSHRWSLSISPSVFDLCCSAASHSKSSYNEVTWFAPDVEVNERIGGHAEKARLEGLVPLRVIEGEHANVATAVATLASCGWLHFRGHGQFAASQLHGPRCSDGVLSVSQIQEACRGSGGILITIACATGFADAVGTEVFGSLADYGSTTLRAAILTLWPIAGEQATVFSAALYGALAEGKPLGNAFQRAVISVRDSLPHPFFWGCFSLVGDWSARLQLTPVTPKQCQTTDRQ